ncbi:MAG: hypothetical protein QXU98_11885 [Candidatus Parvarchaeota archaeon]
MNKEKIDTFTSYMINSLGKKIKEFVEEAITNKFDFIQLNFINGDNVYIDLDDIIEIWYEYDRITILHKINDAMSQVRYSNIDSIALVRNGKLNQTKIYRIQE